MANNFTASTAARNAALAALTALLNGGTIEFYDGTQPSTPDTAISTQNKLATLNFGATAFGTPASGSAAANAITSGNATTAGTTAWCRMKGSGGSAVCDGTVGTSGCDVNLATVSLSVGLTVQVTSLTLSHP